MTSIKSTNGPNDDIVVVGAGLAGAAAALALARKGWRVTVVDRQSVVPKQFRCEKLAALHLEILRKLDLLDVIAQAGQRYGAVIVGREGKSLTTKRVDEIGIRYDELVNTIRQLWPESVKFVRGQVTAITPGPITQTVHLHEGASVVGRLTILATGTTNQVLKNLGITRRPLEQRPTLSVGFDLDACDIERPCKSVTYFGGPSSAGLAYATIFPFRDKLRANVFLFPDDLDNEIGAFRNDALAATIARVPGLLPFTRELRSVGQAEFHVSPQYQSDTPNCDGIVLIGEAFRSTCPTTGSGALCALNDVERLSSAYITRWMASKVRDRQQLARFYRDPIKVARDRRSRQSALAARALASGRGTAINMLPRWLSWKFVSLLERPRLWLTPRFGVAVR